MFVSLKQLGSDVASPLSTSNSHGRSRTFGLPLTRSFEKRVEDCRDHANSLRCRAPACFLEQLSDHFIESHSLARPPLHRRGVLVERRTSFFAHLNSSGHLESHMAVLVFRLCSSTPRKHKRRFQELSEPNQSLFFLNGKISLAGMGCARDCRNSVLRL
jgi:hypothetical protein